MSHFNVLVTLPKTDIDEVDENEGPLLWALQPYQEYGVNLFEDNPRAALEFVDRTEEYREEWGEEWLTPLDEDNFFVRERGFEPGKTLAEQKEYSFEDFCREYHGADRYCGRWGYWTNLDSKWDWFQIGGRFTGSLPVEEGAERFGRPGTMGSGEKNQEDGSSDIAYVREFDFEEAARRSEERLNRFWEEELEPALTGGEVGFRNPFYQLIQEMGYPIGEDFERYSERSKSSDGIVQPEWDSEVGPPTYEKLKEKYSWAFNWSTYAVCHPTEGWDAKGDMGWWGMDSKEQEQYRSYMQSWPDRIRQMDDDTLLVIVDCHV